MGAQIRPLGERRGEFLAWSCLLGSCGWATDISERSGLLAADVGCGIGGELTLCSARGMPSVQR
jgi:hypothetical protein